MKKIMIIMAALALISVSVFAGSVEMKTSGPSGQGNLIWWAPSTGITNLEMTTTGLKNVKLQSGTLTTNVVKQTGAVTATAVVTPQAPSAVTPTITVTATMSTNTWVYLDGSSNVVTNSIVYVSAVSATCSTLPLFATNATVAVTVVGGDAVMTNIVVQSP